MPRWRFSDDSIFPICRTSRLDTFRRSLDESSRSLRWIGNPPAATHQFLAQAGDAPVGTAAASLRLGNASARGSSVAGDQYPTPAQAHGGGWAGRMPPRLERYP